MTDAQGDDDEPVILDGANQPIIADAIAPLALPIGGQLLSAGTGIVAADEMLLDPRLEHSLCKAIQLFEFTVKAWDKGDGSRLLKKSPYGPSLKLRSGDYQSPCALSCGD